jgi:NADH-quinone oxidoreductase subunit J
MPPLSEMPTSRRSARALHRLHLSSSRLAGLVLLVAMIGAIVLTLRHREHVKRQDINQFRSRARRRPPSRWSRSSRAKGI